MRRSTARWPKNLFSAVTCWALLLAGCAHQRTPTAAAALVTPPLVPAAAVSSRSASQVIRAVYGARAVTLRTALEVDTDTVKVVGVTATGQRLFTVNLDGTQVSAQKSAFVPDTVDPARVLADMQLALWPFDALAPAWHSAGLEVSEPYPGVRRVVRGDRLIAEVHYASPDPWRGRLWFVNFEFDYSMTIDTSTTP